MRAWVLILALAAVIALLASPTSFRGGLLDGNANAPLVAAGGLGVVALLLAVFERKHARPRGGWGCGTLILQWVMVGMIAAIGLWLIVDGGRL